MPTRSVAAVTQETRRLVALLTDQPLRILLWTSLFLLAIRPAIESLPGLILVDAVSVGVLVAVVSRLVRSRALFIACLLFLALTIVARSLRAWEGVDAHNPAIAAVATLSSVVSGLFSLFVLGLLLTYVLRAPRVTENTVLAAINAYVLIGVVWGFLYLVLYERDPSAIKLDLKLGTPEVQLRYFSMTTLTTVGFGDIVPASLEARAMAALEALVGQIYLAAIIARLVGTQVAMATTPVAPGGAQPAGPGRDRQELRPEHMLPPHRAAAAEPHEHAD